MELDAFSISSINLMKSSDTPVFFCKEFLVRNTCFAQVEMERAYIYACHTGALVGVVNH